MKNKRDHSNGLDLQQNTDKEESAVPEYRSTWKALPIDGSESGWEKLFGFPRHSISYALSTLEENAWQKPDSLYCQIKPPKIKNAEGPNTHPARLYWETQPLIKALTEAWCSKRRIGKEELAKETVQQLAHDLAKADLSKITYQQIQLLKAPLIRRRMLRFLQEKIKMRIKAIEAVTQNPPVVAAGDNIDKDSMTVQNIMMLCEAIDSKMGDIVCGASYPKTTAQEVTVADISALYKDLITVREAITHYSEGDEEYITSLGVLKNGANEAIIQQLEGILFKPQRKRDNDAIEAAYADYLLTALPTASKREPEAFAKNFMALKNFTAGERDYFYWVPIVRQNLIQHICGIFQDLESLNIIGYAYIDRNSKSIDTMFLDEYIKNIRQQIQYEIHKPFQLLYKAKILEKYISLNKVENIIGFLTIGTDGFLTIKPDEFLDTKAKIAALLSDMEKVTAEIASYYPQLPLGPLTKDFPVREFVEYYNKNIAPELKAPALDIKKTENNLIAIQTGPFPKRFGAIIFILQKVCMMVAFAKMEENLAIIQEIYNNLTQFYKTITSDSD